MTPGRIWISETIHVFRKVERTLDMDVNLRDKYGRTALMWAAEQGHVAAIETLLDLGADRTIRDSHTNRSADHKPHKPSKCCQALS